MTGMTQTDPSALDYSMLRREDFINIVLQRSETLADVRRPGDLIRAWSDGDPAPLNRVVEVKGAVLAQRAVRKVQSEFDVLTPVLDRLRPRKVADIGCGYGFFDLFLYHRYGTKLLLIDIEQNEHRHFGFSDEAAAYANLDTARAFLERNGVAPEDITTWNPEADELDEENNPDLAVSFLSCGYHFPIDMYLPFFRFGVAPGGAVILDIRAGRFQDTKRQLQRLGRVSVLSAGGGFKRVLLRKGRR